MCNVRREIAMNILKRLGLSQKKTFRGGIENWFFCRMGSASCELRFITWILQEISTSRDLFSEGVGRVFLNWRKKISLPPPIGLFLGQLITLQVWVSIVASFVILNLWLDFGEEFIDLFDFYHLVVYRATTSHEGITLLN